MRSGQLCRIRRRNVFDDFAGDMVKIDFTRTQEIHEWLSWMDYYKDIEMGVIMCTDDYVCEHVSVIDATSHTITVISFDGYMDLRASGTGNKKINLQISGVTIPPSKTTHGFTIRT